MKHLKPTHAKLAAFLILLYLSVPGCSATSQPHGSEQTTGRQQIDLIVEGDYVVRMESSGVTRTNAVDTSRNGLGVDNNAAVAVDKGIIIAIGPVAEINSRYQANNRLKGSNQVVMPGLINGHSHAAMTLLRGIAEDLSLSDWLNNYIFPAEVEFVDADFVRIGTELACWEMIRGGTTTFADMYYFPDVAAQVVASCGMRALIAATVIDQRSPDAKNAADSLDKGLKFIQRWKGKNSRITPTFGPHSNYTLNADQLRAVRDAAIDTGVTINIHMSESPYEIQHSKSAYGTTSIEFFDSIGLFDVATIGAHVVWPTESEISVLAERDVGVIHNPTSNMKTAAGIAPISRMLQAGIHVGLGTDGAASNNDLDLWEEMRLAALLQKVDQMNPEVMPASAVLNMATLGGAQAIGMSDRIGSLAVGKRADIIQVSLHDVHFIPTYDVISHLVYVADEQDVNSVVVDGKILMRDKEILTIDTARVKKEATALAARIHSKLGSKE